MRIPTCLSVAWCTFSEPIVVLYAPRTVVPFTESVRVAKYLRAECRLIPAPLPSAMYLPAIHGTRIGTEYYHDLDRSK
ncbi:MAG: hypothetical protein R3B84_13550 [Zavarzinella sp.]